MAKHEIPNTDNWDETAAQLVYKYKKGDIIIAPTPAIKAACINGLRALRRVDEKDIDVRL